MIAIVCISQNENLHNETYIYIYLFVISCFLQEVIYENTRTVLTYVCFNMVQMN